jgi:hypothetical protein
MNKVFDIAVMSKDDDLMPSGSSKKKLRFYENITFPKSISFPVSLSVSLDCLQKSTLRLYDDRFWSLQSLILRIVSLT